jgi:hypothetical protein
MSPGASVVNRPFGPLRPFPPANPRSRLQRRPQPRLFLNSAQSPRRFHLIPFREMLSARLVIVATKRPSRCMIPSNRSELPESGNFQRAPSSDVRMMPFPTHGDKYAVILGDHLQPLMRAGVSACPLQPVVGCYYRASMTHHHKEPVTEDNAPQALVRAGILARPGNAISDVRSVPSFPTATTFRFRKLHRNSGMECRTNAAPSSNRLSSTLAEGGALEPILCTGPPPKIPQETPNPGLIMFEIASHQAAARVDHAAS